MKKAFEIFISILLFFLVFYIYQGQERISNNNGHGWDGEHYYQSALQVSKGEFPVVEQTPFVNRIGLHFTVGTFAKTFNKDIIESAFIVNTIAILISVILLQLWLMGFIQKAWIRYLLQLLYLTAWHSGIRNIYFDTIATDPWGAVFFLAGLNLLSHIKNQYSENKNITISIIGYSLIVFFGTLFRESVAALAIAILFITSPIKHSDILSYKLKTLNLSQLVNTLILEIKKYFTTRNIILFLPFIAVIAAKVFTGFCVEAPNSYSYPKALARWFYEKSLAEFMVGTFLSYGPLILLTSFYWKRIRHWLSDKEEFTILLLFGIFFGYFGGGDTERILFMSTFPIIFVFLAFAIEDLWNNSKTLLAAILILQSLAYRIFWHLPDYPNDFTIKPIPFFGLIGEKFDHLYLYSTHGNIYINTILFVEYAALFTVLYFWHRKRKANT